MTKKTKKTKKSIPKKQSKDRDTKPCPYPKKPITYEPFNQDLIFKKPIEILIYIYNNEGKSQSSISKQTEVSYAHFVKVITKLEKSGLIRTERLPRDRIVFLTSKGQDLALSLIRVKEVLK